MFWKNVWGEDPGPTMRPRPWTNIKFLMSQVQILANTQVVTTVKCIYYSWGEKDDVKIGNAAQIFAHTFPALFWCELLLAENSCQTLWLPKRKKKKNNQIKKSNNINHPKHQEDRPFNISSYRIIGPSYKRWSPFNGPYISLSFM